MKNLTTFECSAVTTDPQRVELLKEKVRSAIVPAEVERQDRRDCADLLELVWRCDSLIPRRTKRWILG